MTIGSGGSADINSVASQLETLMSGSAEEEQDNSMELDPGSDDDAPEMASGEEEAQEPAVKQPAIEPPASWDGEAKEQFKKLPPNVQEFISKRESERDKGISQKLQEVAEARKAIEAKYAETTQLRSAYEQRLMAQAKQLESSIPEEFRNIRSAADLYAVSQRDPALAARFTAFQQQAASVMNELQQLESARTQELQNSYREHLVKEQEAISKAWPDFMDQTKGPVIRAELSQYAKEHGFADSEIGALADHRLVMVLRDAVEGRKAIKALEQAKSKVQGKNLPKVAKPGQGEVSSGRGIDRQTARSIARSGDMSRTVDALEKMLSRG